jgi:RNA-binding protein NOB1
MSKQFCPRCGGPTLIKANSSVTSSGEMKIHLKKDFHYRLRGTRYSLPKPKGGRENKSLILREDTKEFQAAERYAKKLRKETLAADDPDQGVFSSNHFSGGRERANVSTKTGKVILGTGKSNPNAVGHKMK